MFPQSAGAVTVLLFEFINAVLSFFVLNVSPSLSD